jgi:hypothetical protein
MATSLVDEANSSPPQLSTLVDILEDFECESDEEGEGGMGSRSWNEDDAEEDDAFGEGAGSSDNFASGELDYSEFASRRKSYVRAKRAQTSGGRPKYTVCDRI